MFVRSLPLELAPETVTVTAESELGSYNTEDLSDIDDEDVFFVPVVTQPSLNKRTYVHYPL